MLHTVLLFTILWVTCTAISDIYFPRNVSRSKPTISGIAQYRSSLTLDWLAAEDLRQRELAGAFETEASVPVQVLVSDCISYSRPASGKVARLMLELLKNLEGDDGSYIPELIQVLIRSNLLVETSMLDAEPDLDSLVETPRVMMGEPHATFPRILAMVWMAATDPSTVKRNGWCPIHKVAKYLAITKSVVVAKHMRNLDPIVARARFVMEEFIQHVTPNMYQKNLMRTTLLNEIHRKYLRTRPSFKVKVTRTPPQAPNLKLPNNISLNEDTEKSLSDDEQNKSHSKPYNDHDHFVISDDFKIEMKKAEGSVILTPKILLLVLIFCAAL